MGDDAPKRSLEYDRGSGTVSVRGMRFLVALTLINTLLLTWFAVVGMQGPQMIQQRWRQWQDQRQREKVFANAIAKQRELMNHAFAPDTVIYTEDPRRIAAAGSAYRPIRVAGPTVPEWPAPVLLDAPAEWNGVISNGGTNTITRPTIVLFLHERTSPEGDKRLVIVQLDATQTFERTGGTARTDRVETYRRLNVAAIKEIDPKVGLASPAIKTGTELRISPNESLVTRSANGTYEVKPAPALTLFAGQADPADASHAMIPYEIDGRPGIIDVWLRTRDLLVKPRQGIARFESGREAWELGVSPATAPATSSASSP